MPKFYIYVNTEYIQKYILDITKKSKKAVFRDIDGFIDKWHWFTTENKGSAKIFDNDDEFVKDHKEAFECNNFMKIVSEE